MALVYLENSYLASADDYLADNPDWEAETLVVQEQALIDATYLLDQQPWIGVAVDPTQTLAWPREAGTFFDPVLNLWVSYTAAEIPIRLQKATAQLALHLVRYPEAISGAYDTRYTSISVGPIELSSGQSAGSPPRIPQIPTTVNRLIMPLLLSGATSAGWWRSN